MKHNISNQAYEASVYRELLAKHPGKRIIQSYIRLEKPLDNNNPSLIFDHNVNVSTQTKTEQRLQKNDVFVMLKTKLGIYRRDKVLKDETIKVLQSYPNPIVFPDGVDGLITEHLEAVWNSEMEIKKSSTSVLDRFPTAMYREVSETQQSSAFNKSSASMDGGFVLHTPRFEIKGGESTEIKFNAASIAGGYKWQHTANNNEIVLAFVSHGFLVVNGDAK